MKKEGFNPESFAYPYGAKYWFTDFLLHKRFKVLRSVAGIPADKDLTKLDDIYYGFDNSHTLSALGIDQNSGVTNEMIQHAMKRASQKKEVLSLYGHSPTNKTDSNSYSFDIKRLEFILKEAKKNDFAYYTISELAESD
jgi:hypothetical protein